MSKSVAAEYLPKALAVGYRVSILGLHKATDAPRLASLGGFLSRASYAFADS